MANAISEDAREFLKAAGVRLQDSGYGQLHVVHPGTGRLVDPERFIKDLARADELATGSDMSMYAEEILSPRAGSSKNAEWMRRVRQMGEKVRPHINIDHFPGSTAEAARLYKMAMKVAPKALATGVAAKLMLGGAAKAAGLPGLGEAAEMAGREDPSLQQFFREQEEGITGALGLPQRSQMPVYSMDPAREGAARVMLRTGRQNLRPGFDEPAITKQELEYVKKKAAPRAK